MSTRLSVRRRRAVGGAAVAALAGLLGALAVPPATAQESPVSELPIVFVHGNSGSVQQFASQFQRFSSNGYPDELLFAYEYDSSGPANDVAVAGLEPFIDDVLEQTGAPQVHLVAHSRGTTVSHAYLATPARAAEVADYINLDGRTSDTPPGGVRTLAVWGEWNSPPDPTRGTVGVIGGGAQNVYNRDKGHNGVVSDPQTFSDMWRFLFGSVPATPDVVPQPAAGITVAGRAVLFPSNVGFAGSTLDVFEVDPATGERTAPLPFASYEIDASGAFGPLRVDGERSYEFALVRPGGTTHHFYQEPFRRSDHFLRLNSGPAGVGLESFTPRSDDHSNITVVRQRELWGDQAPAQANDRLTFAVEGDAAAPVNVLTPATSPRSNVEGDPLGSTGVNVAMFATDVGAATGPTTYGAPDRQSDLAKGQLFPFSTLSFLGGVDLFLPADAEAGRTIEVALTARGGGRAVVAQPNWPSSTHRSTVAFRDDVQADAPAAPAARGTTDACVPGRVPSNAFPDDDAGVHEAAVDCLAWYGIARGTTPTAFGPSGPVTRGQLASFLARLIGQTSGELAAGPDAFTDDAGVHEADVNALAAAGIALGRGGGRFEPGLTVSRGEAAALLVRTFQYVSGRPLETSVDWFTDDQGTTHEDAINAAAAAGFTVGRSAGAFGPTGTLSRGEAASLLTRSLDLLVEEGSAAPR